MKSINACVYTHKSGHRRDISQQEVLPNMQSNDPHKQTSQCIYLKRLLLSQTLHCCQANLNMIHWSAIINILSLYMISHVYTKYSDETSFWIINCVTCIKYICKWLKHALQWLHHTLFKYNDLTLLVHVMGFMRSVYISATGDWFWDEVLCVVTPSWPIDQVYFLLWWLDMRIAHHWWRAQQYKRIKCS